MKRILAKQLIFVALAKNNVLLLVMLKFYTRAIGINEEILAPFEVHEGSLVNSLSLDIDTRLQDQGSIMIAPHSPRKMDIHLYRLVR